MKHLSFLIPTLLLTVSSALLAQEKPGPEISLDVLRDPAVVENFRTLPVQESGRIKPLDTVARFLLLRMSGKQSIAVTESGIGGNFIGKLLGLPQPEPLTDPSTGKKIVDAKGNSIKLSAMEWLLVCWFKPELAKDMRVLVVDNSDAVIALGLAGKEKRDRYSFNELSSARDRILQKMKELSDVPVKDRKSEDRAMAKLGSDFGLLAMIVSHMDFARAPFGDQEKSLPAELATEWQKSNGHLGVFLPKLADYVKVHPEAGAPMGNPWLGVLWFRTRLGAGMSDNPENLLRIFPPVDRNVEVWRGPGSIIQSALQGSEVTAEDYANLTRYGELAVTTDATAFKAKLDALHKLFSETAAARAKPVVLDNKIVAPRVETNHVTLEVSYHKADYFFNALIYFIFGLLALALSWVAPAGGWGKWCARSSLLLMIVGEVYAVIGIVVRCIIMGRPPITTLYETILFITTTAVLLGLIAEWMTRKRLALAVACIAGTAGMFLSIRFMTFEARDTMEQLQAVLITNFWLSTHVPCINLGYAAGMVACIFSIVYFFQRLFGVAQAGDVLARDITRIAYGFVMAGLFLSLVGTVLGGIWANYSWGRFWGWDPKENGALMIVLMNLVILHARLGGYVKEAGFHCCCIMLGMITVFSWFGVNQLGVGLHSYGFTDGVWKWLYIFWIFLFIILIYGMFRAWFDRQARKIKQVGSFEITKTYS